MMTLIEALQLFTRHYEPWMDNHSDDTESCTFSRHTLGQLREARAALTAALSGSPQVEAGIDYGVLRKAHYFTLAIDGEVHGLTAGDMGYEPTGIKIPVEDIAAWQQDRAHPAPLPADGWKEGIEAADKNALQKLLAAIDRFRDIDPDLDRDASEECELEIFAYAAAIRALPTPPASTEGGADA